MKKKRREDLLAVALGVLCVAVLGGVVAVFVQMPRDTLDELDCPSPAGPVSNAVLLLDASDRLSDLQRDWLRGKLDAWAKGVPRGGRARVFTLGDGKEPLRQDFDRCNPGDGAGESWLAANPDRLRKRWDSAFARPLEDRLALGDTTHASSPLVEALQLLSVRAGLEPSSPAARTLLVVSDLMQHSAAYSMYASGCANPEATLAANARRWSADLSGVTLKVLLIPREGPSCTPAELVVWWQHVLGHGMEVAIDRVDVAPGLAPGAATPVPAR